jgi:uncharacterized protein with von Willebrand factor type A (vWA) domain
MKNNYQLPLYLFFEQLQKNRFALDIISYQQVLKAMQGGFGLNNQSELFQLCKMVWYKPQHDLVLFERLFKVYFEEEKQEAIRIFQIGQQAKNTKSQPIKPERKPIDETPEIESKNDTEQNTDFETDKKEERNKSQEDNTLGETDETEYTTVQLSIGDKKSNKNYDVENSQSPDEFTFKFSNDYLPFSKRKLILNWRKIQNIKGFRGQKILDIEKTIDSIPIQGKYIQPIFSYATKQQRPTYILIDKGGSMAAYDAMIAQFAAIIKKHFTQTEILYFYNVPQDYLFQNTTHTEGIAKEQFFKKCKSEQPNIIIISDAGAARGHFSEERIATTNAFLMKLPKHGKSTIWLNPMPQQRWKYNSAQAIAANTNMLELVLNTIQKAAKHLQK